MHVVGAGSGDDIDHRASVAAVFGTKLRLEIELLDGINGEKRCGSAADSNLIERGIIEEGIVVVGAIQGVVVGPVAVAVDRELPESALYRGHPRWFHGSSWHQGD